jgi:hypothetical protein
MPTVIAYHDVKATQHWLYDGVLPETLVILTEA